MCEASRMPHSLEATDVVTPMLTRIQTLRAAGVSPVVVFDLDGTLFDNGPRTWQILVDFAEIDGAEELRTALDSLPRTGLPYLLSDILARCNVGVGPLLDRAEAFWRARFFTDGFQRFDEPLPGAVSFARRAFAAGATLIYLSGRDSPNMLVGCTESLRRHGFPVGVPRTAILLKDAFETPDYDFKRDAIAFIDTVGTVVASFDNEPVNCNLFIERWPEAAIVLIDTHHAPEPPALLPGVGIIADFREHRAQVEVSHVG